MATITYREAGVDIDAGDELVDRIGPAAASTMRPEVIAGVGGFASLVGVPAGYRDPVIVAGTDGVGTKLKLAFAMNDHSTVGIDLVAMCANDVIAMGGEPLFFLDYYATSRLEPEAAAQVIAGIAEGCRQAGCALVGGETAELPGFYREGEYDLAGFLVGIAERDGILTGASVREGDAVIGIASSGVHSNGYSLVRAVIERSGARLDETPDGFEEPLGRTLLRPTAIYANAVRALRAAVEVRALAHITGGGLLENVPRTIPDGLAVRLQPGWPVPRVFRWLAEAGPVEEMEMLRTFNMGIGMTAVVPSDRASRAVDALRDAGQPASVIGVVVRDPGLGRRVLFEGTV